MKNKSVFKIGDVELAAVKPNAKQVQEASLIYGAAWAKNVKNGLIMRKALDQHLRDQGVWNDAKDKEFRELQSSIDSKVKLLSRGGIKLKEAKKLALEISTLRATLRLLLMDRTAEDNNTAEGQAENAKFNYLVSVCVVYNDTGKPYYSSLEDYLNKSAEPEAFIIAGKLAELLYGYDSDFEKSLPENKFLREYGFVDEDFRFINSEGKRTDSEGRLVNEDGRFINEEGEFVDADGNRVDEDGNPVVDTQPFLDDEGNPIVKE